MNRMIVFSVVLVVFAISACNSDRDLLAHKKECCSGMVTKDNAVDHVIGSWKWIETSYFSANRGQLLKTPQTTGKMLTYTFDNDTLTISSGGMIIEKTRYEIGTLRDITHFTQDTTLIIRLFNAENSHKISLLHFCGDSMILVNSYNSMGGNIKLRKEG
ncbi:MAG: hypothetical protein JW973_07150 [Bacteroidales bacterium]|nr:hypothetical protein [Bacteroidales bacterium]